MENPVQNHLQAELARIETEAARHSALICAKADELELAHQLCAVLNAHGNFISPLKPHPVYYFSDCAILIYTEEDGLQTLSAAQAAGLEMTNTGPTYEGSEYFACPAFPGVKVIIRSEYAQAFAQPCAEAA
jgi:hypothetical protein